MSNAVTIAQQGSTGVASGFKNRLINGAFDFWQRGTAQTFVTSGQYLADRWTCMGFQQARHQRVAVSNRVEGLTAQYAMRVSSSLNSDNGSGGTRMDLSQKIENANSYDLAGVAVVYSFWIRFSSPTATSITNLTQSAFGNFNAYLASSTSNTDAATSSDSIGSVNGITTITNGSLPTTWTKVTGTAIIPSTANNVALRLQFTQLGSTTNAGDVWYEVTEIQLEEGTSPTGFDRRSYGTEFELCRRYFEQVDYFQRFCGPSGISTAFTYIYNPFKTTKRNTSYTVYQSNAGGGTYSSRSNTVVLFSPTPGGDFSAAGTISNAYLNGCTINGTPSNGTTGGTYTLWIDNEL